MYIARNPLDNSVIKSATGKSSEYIWTKVDTLPAPIGELTWLEGEPLPTVDATKVAEKSRQSLKETRDTALASLVHTMPDDSVVQVRPADVPNIQLAIALGTDQEWLLADNTVKVLTVVELQTALNDGILKGKAIWDAYLTAVKAL